MKAPPLSAQVEQAMFGDGSQTRSFCYASDLVDGLYRLMLSDERYPVNLCNPREMTVLEFAERILKLTHSSPPIERRPLPEDDPGSVNRTSQRPGDSWDGSRASRSKRD